MIQHEDKEAFYNYLMLAGVILILLSGMFLIIYYFNQKNNTCVADPFVFGAQRLEDLNPGVEVFGTVIFKTDTLNNIEPIYFTSSPSQKSEKKK